jgi:hypothetical protein
LSVASTRFAIGWFHVTSPQHAWKCCTARGRQTKPVPRANQKTAILKLVGENVFQSEIQLAQQRFQFVQRQMLRPVLDAEKCLVRNAGPLGELGVGQIAPFFSHEICQLLVKVASHCRKMANNP